MRPGFLSWLRSLRGWREAIAVIPSASLWKQCIRDSPNQIFVGLPLDSTACRTLPAKPATFSVRAKITDLSQLFIEQAKGLPQSPLAKLDGCGGLP
jgi:hypothetical protein